MTNKLKYFIGNWKMFGDLSSLKIIYQVHKFCARFKRRGKKNKIILCVPNTLIYFFTTKLKSKFISIGAQNCHHHKTYGPFTGSVSASMLKKIGAKYIILGHSENRSEGDTGQLIKKKIELALKQKLNIIFCIGETFKEKKEDKTFLVLRKQIRDSIDKKYNLNKVIIAYEPIWSIGTGKIPEIQELKKIFIFIKNEFKKNFKTKIFPVVLYGGSVNDSNIKLFSSISEIDGFLIGGASQSSKKFIDIIKNYYK
ncbi:MAG TPA: triose-phosphate isomerase family protein [Pelagibacteraceae bacterium]|jgi:triosephosphate isomerase|nr:triose-phosphate isomerase family protein [Pelagibacteraceae bacterium]|tara:strand:- start:1474 stop:2235 length:762 start_codon:yes stop_codon:yes gene_type:complete